MKLLKSTCEKAWFFNAEEEENSLHVGLACFLPSCKHEVEVEIDGKLAMVMVPKRAINSPMPTRASNARLSLFLK